MNVVKNPAFLSYWNRLMNTVSNLLSTIYGDHNTKEDVRWAIRSVRAELDELEKMIEQD